MRTYSLDLRERIIASRKDGHSAGEVARLFRVSRRSVERYWKKHQSTGTVEAKQRGGYRRSCLEGYDESLRAWINAEKDLTLAQLRERICSDLGIKVGNTALWHRLERLGLSYKKNAARRRARPGGPPGRPPKLAAKTRRLGGKKTGLSR
jgi:transposase